MQNTTAEINAIGAIGIGFLTFVVVRRVLKACPMLDSCEVALLVAGLTTVCLGSGDVMGSLFLVCGALGLSLAFILLLLPFLKDKRTKKEKLPPGSWPSGGKEDPWEKELRRRGTITGKKLTR